MPKLALIMRVLKDLKKQNTSLSVLLKFVMLSEIFQFPSPLKGFLVGPLFTVTATIAVPLIYIPNYISWLKSTIISSSKFGRSMVKFNTIDASHEKKIWTPFSQR